MDIRNIQKTGKMHYIYLPTAWCKRYGINSDSKVSLEISNDGTITVSPQLKEKKLKQINLTIADTDQELITKLIMACYINPTKSFKIELKKETDVAKLLDQKKAISSFEFVELDGNRITYESSVTIDDTSSLLKTMVKKIKNLINIMLTNYNEELINRYEEEIDRSKILINKSVTSALALNMPSNMKAIELYYAAQISQHLERMVDSIILVDKKEVSFLKPILPIIEDINIFLEKIENLDYTKAIDLAKKALAIKSPRIENINSYGKRRIRSNLISVSDVFLDWAITKELSI